MHALHPRSTPFELVFEPIAQQAFPTVRASLMAAGHDPRNRDAFFMQPEVVSLLHHLRPEEGLGEGIDQLAALVHHAYLYWNNGSTKVEVTSQALPDLLGGAVGAPTQDIDPPAYYLQVPERRVWAQVVPGQPPEPLDGCFVHALPGASLIRVLGVFGVHPERSGFSVVEASGGPRAVLVRQDGSALFASLLPGGAAAGLFSLAGEEELLELGWRTLESAAAASAETS